MDEFGDFDNMQDNQPQRQEDNGMNFNNDEDPFAEMNDKF